MGVGGMGGGQAQPSSPRNAAPGGSSAVLPVGSSAAGRSWGSDPRLRSAAMDEVCSALLPGSGVGFGARGGALICPVSKVSPPTYLAGRRQAPARFACSRPPVPAALSAHHVRTLAECQCPHVVYPGDAGTGGGCMQIGPAGYVGGALLREDTGRMPVFAQSSISIYIIEYKLIELCANTGILPVSSRKREAPPTACPRPLARRGSPSSPRRRPRPPWGRAGTVPRIRTWLNNIYILIEFCANAGILPAFSRGRGPQKPGTVPRIRTWLNNIYILIEFCANAGILPASSLPGAVGRVGSRGPGPRCDWPAPPLAQKYNSSRLSAIRFFRREGARSVAVSVVGGFESRPRLGGGLPTNPLGTKKPGTARGSGEERVRGWLSGPQIDRSDRSRPGRGSSGKGVPHIDRAFVSILSMNLQYIDRRSVRPSNRPRPEIDFIDRVADIFPLGY
nr:hypothetical protein Beed-S103_00063 [Bovine alphaherpesvirus 5]